MHERPIVTFTFDDFPRSALLQGAPIIERFGGRATFYASMGLMNTTNKLGEQFEKRDLLSLIERGHELGSHTFRHVSAWNTPSPEYLRDVTRGQLALRADLGVSADNFAYPYGEATLRTKKSLSTIMGSCRGTCPGFNGPAIDLNLLRANSLYGGAQQVDWAKSLIRQNELRNTWLIFYTHDVATTPSPFGCTPELLEGVVSYAATREYHIFSVEQVLSHLRSTEVVDSTETSVADLELKRGLVH